MDELLKLSIEELENILAITPFSEVHQMALATKKKEISLGALHQIEEDGFYKMHQQQEEFTKKIIASKIKESLQSHVEDTEAIIDDEALPVKEGSIEVVLEKGEEKKKKEKKKKKSTSKIKESLQSHVEDTEAIIVDEALPVKGGSIEVVLEKGEEKKKKEKKKKKKKSKKERKKDKKEESKKEKTKKKLKKKKKKIKKVKKEKKVSSKNIKKKQKKSDKKSKGSSSKKKKSKKKSNPGLSDFSKWLMARSSGSVINEMKPPSKKSKKKKSKKKSNNNENLVSEPLADLLAAQGHTVEAIDMYNRLSLIFPEKNAFFAAKIENIQKEL